MSLITKLEQRTVLVALIIVILCALISLSPYLPLFVLFGHLAAALYLIVGVALSLRSPNELAMPPLQFAGRILHAQFFYALIVALSASGVFFCARVLLNQLGFVYATRWAMLVAFSLALSTPIVMAAFSRFLLSRTAGWDREGGRKKWWEENQH